MLHRMSRLALITVAACLPAMAEDPVAMPKGEPNAFDLALKEAADQGRYLLVAVTSDSDESRRFADETLKDAEVVAWIGKRAVLLVLSTTEPIGMNFASAHQVNELPTLLVMASDGRELGRQIGLVDARRLMIRIDGATQGESIRTETGVVSWAGEDVVLAAMDRADKLTTGGKHAEALDEYVWCLEHRATMSPLFPIVHMPKLIHGLATLAKAYEPAMTEIRRRIGRAESNSLKSERPDVYSFYMLKYAYTELGEGEQLVAHYDKLNRPTPHSNRALGFARLIYKPLLDAQRYDALRQTVLDEQDVSTFIDESRTIKRDPAEVLKLMSERYEILLGIGMEQDAKNLVKTVLDYIQTPETYLVLAEAALRSRRSTDDDIQLARQAHAMVGSQSARPVTVLARLLIQRNQADQEATQLLLHAQQTLQSKEDQDAITMCLHDIQTRKIHPRLPPTGGSNPP